MSIRGKNWGIIVYPDNANQMDVFTNYILSEEWQKQDHFRPVCIEHQPETDEKKEHIHVMLCFDYAVTDAGLRRMLGFNNPTGKAWRLMFKTVNAVQDTNLKKGENDPDYLRKTKAGLEGSVVWSDTGLPVSLPYDAAISFAGTLEGRPNFVPLFAYTDPSSPFSLIGAVTPTKWLTIPGESLRPSWLKPVIDATTGQIISEVPNNCIWKLKDDFIFPHVEKISNPHAYAQYMLHGDHVSVMNGKTRYDVSALYGDKGLIDALLNGNSINPEYSILYNITQQEDVHTFTDVYRIALTYNNPALMSLVKNAYMVRCLLSDRDYHKRKDNVAPEVAKLVDQAVSRKYCGLDIGLFKKLSSILAASFKQLKEDGETSVNAPELLERIKKFYAPDVEEDALFELVTRKATIYGIELTFNA